MFSVANVSQPPLTFAQPIQNATPEVQRSEAAGCSAFGAPLPPGPTPISYPALPLIQTTEEQRSEAVGSDVASSVPPPPSPMVVQAGDVVQAPDEQRSEAAGSATFPGLVAQPVPPVLQSSTPDEQRSEAAGSATLPSLPSEWYLLTCLFSIFIENRKKNRNKTRQVCRVFAFCYR